MHHLLATIHLNKENSMKDLFELTIAFVPPIYKNPFIIAAIALVLAFLFLMLAISLKKRRAIKCLSCGTQLRVNDRFCPRCGYQSHKEVRQYTPPLNQQYIPIVLAVPTVAPTVCLSCRAAIQPGEVFCGRCGNRVIPSATQTYRQT